MSTVKSIVRRLCPSGTNRGPTENIERFPFWPPDLFAVCATIINMSGCYARPRYMASESDECLFREDGYRSTIEKVGRDFGLWGSEEDNKVITKESPSEETIEMMQDLWNVLLNEPSDNLETLGQECADAAIKLMMIADEASGGIGFIQVPQRILPYSDLVFDEHSYLLEKQKRLLPHLPHSLCLMVPSCELCIQPKTMTSQVGCTLRSLSHHLALLPPMAEVATKWLFGVEYSDLEDKEVDRDSPINLLLVPFPYTIAGSCFQPGPKCLPDANDQFSEHASKWRFFDVHQHWLKENGQALTAEDIAGYLLKLIEVAKRDVENVHGVILPEIALTHELATEVAAVLAKNRSGLDILITGVTHQDKPSAPNLDKPGRITNGVQTFLFINEIANGDEDGGSEKGKVLKSQVYSEWFQSKHHRWKLDRDQVTRYQLGGQLDPSDYWWERTNIHDRSCTFYTVRPGMSLATLVCEDLARIDPVQTVIRSIGPNLVVALLMDGAQAENRWSGRYATILADDPGSAVLTLTSLGLLRRARESSQANTRQIGLWKGAEGKTIEIHLPRNHHAVITTLSRSNEVNFTIDGRADDGCTYKLSLSAVIPVKHPGAPKWAEVD